jgi:hypothetical protein
VLVKLATLFLFGELGLCLLGRGDPLGFCVLGAFVAVAEGCRLIVYGSCSISDPHYGGNWGNNAMVTVFWDVDPLPDHISVDGGEERRVF